MISLPDSPFAAVLDTNYAPSPQEIIRIKSVVLEPSKRLIELDEEISRLKADRERLQAFVNKHNTLLSPIRRLSTDMLIEIFTQCLPEGFPTRDITQAPLLLTRVCRSWREMALETPKLWDTIHINLPIPLNESDQGRYNLLLHARKDGLESWLERSGAMPINVSVSMGLSGSQMRTPAWNTSPSFYRDIYRDFGTLVSRYSSRWRTLTLTHVPDNIMDAFVAHLSSGSLPLLENISVTALRTDSERPQKLLVHLLEAADTHRLSRLHMCRIPEAIFDRKTPHRSTLTHLHVVDPSGSLLPSVLIERFARLFPSLTECALVFSPHILSTSVTTTPDPYTDAPVRWPSLRKLHLSFHGLGFFRSSFRREAITIEEIRKVFDAVLTPSLTELAVHHIVDSSLADIPRSDQQREAPFHEFIIQSGCASTLTHLNVNLILQEEVLLRSLEALPSLKSLIVKQERPLLEGPLRRLDRATGRDVDPARPLTRPLLNQRFFRELTPGFQQDAVGAICPCLEEIEILDCSPDDVDTILQLARMRAGPPEFNMQVTRLRSFKVKFGQQSKEGVDRLDSHDVRNELARLRAGGLRVDWSWVEGEVHVVDRPTDGMPALWYG
ncbi:hypothetical protein AAF712_005247 [Marasmius tenuissimus]|uniref:F-box domain-containing protein n=1 Tax=Marasmius tenuissimus TaxID=585030 RepID=A0ABR3A376_9AGAR